MMRDWVSRGGRLPTCVCLVGLSGCAILPGAGMPFPDETAAEPRVEPVLPSPRAQPSAAPGPIRLPALPPLVPLVTTQLDETTPVPALDEQILSLLVSEPLSIRVLLLQETDLSLAPDPGVIDDEIFTGELKNVTIRQALDVVLRPLDLDYRVEDAVLRVTRRPRQTRVFEVNFVTTRRVSGGSADGGATPTEHVSIDDLDFFAELEQAVRPLLSAGGSAHMGRAASLLQVTDLPERVDTVGRYLDRVFRRASRQIRIEARFVEVALGDHAAAGLDWQVLSRAVPALLGGDRISIRPVLPTPADVDQFLEALEQQGVPTTLARPTVVTMNNQPVVIRVDTRGPLSEAPTGILRPVSAGVLLSMTPQVGLDGLVTLSVTPRSRRPPCR